MHYDGSMSALREIRDLEIRFVSVEAVRPPADRAWTRLHAEPAGPGA